MNETITPAQLRQIAQEVQDNNAKAVLKMEERKVKEDEEWLSNAIATSLKKAREVALSGEQQVVVMAIDRVDIKDDKRRTHASSSELRQVHVNDLVGKKQKLASVLGDMGFDVGLTIERAYEDPNGADNPFWHEPYLQLTIGW